MSTFKTIALSTLLALAALNSAQAKKYTVGGGNATQQLAQVESHTELETFTGRTDKVSGTITFDQKKKSGSGKVSVDVASIDTGIPTRNDHMLSAGWLNAAKHPSITFEVKSTKPLGNDRYQVTGTFTLRGVTKTLTTTATVKHKKSSEATKKAGFKGDVLQVRTSFPIKLSDFGIKISGPATGKVSNNVTITVTTYAQSGA